MTEVVNGSRFRLLKYGEAAPASCLITGIAEDLVDTGLSIPWHGAVYLSVEVLREIALVAGINQSEAAIDERLEAARNEGRLEGRAEGYAEGIAELEHLRLAANRITGLLSPDVDGGAGPVLETVESEEAAVPDGEGSADSGAGPDRADGIREVGKPRSRKSSAGSTASVTDNPFADLQ